MRNIQFIIIHHSATPSKSNTSDIDGSSIINSIMKEHKERWKAEFPGYVCDYHYLIGPTGRVFEGQPEELPGWHATNYQVNMYSLGICFTGNFEREIMPKAQFDAGTKLIRKLVEKHSVPLSGILMHRDVVSDVTGKSHSTACPGKNFPFLELLRRLSLPFSDIDEGYPYLEEINYLRKSGIIQGSEGSFRPKDYATREEVALMIFRALRSI